MRDTRQAAPRITESESLALGAVLFLGAVVVLSWTIGAAGLRVQPVVVFVGAFISAEAWRRFGLAGSRSRLDLSAWRLAGFLLVVTGFLGYVCSLSWPSLLPLGDGPDLVHHLSLIHFIQQRNRLPYDPAFGVYLGEMDGYTPGSHLLAAITADWLGLDAMRLFHPIIAVAVGLKAGLLYNVILRVLPEGRQQPAPAVAGTLLLLVPHAYLLRPFTQFQFYAQVIAETFAVAMIWTIVIWHQHGESRWLAVFAFAGVTVALCWPVWVPAPVLALAIVAVIRDGESWGRRIRHIVLAVAPIALLLAAYTAMHTRSTSVLGSGGSTLLPSVALVGGWFFAALTVAGLALAIRRRAAMAPVLACGLACLAQIVGLLVLQRALRASNPYLAYKTVHLLIYPVVVCAALALEEGWHRCGRVLPVLERGERWGLVLCVLAWLWRSDLPRRPVPSPITLPVYHAGLWAKAHLPAPCVDYIVDPWVTAYWLHVDVLGNPRESTPLDSGRFGYRPTVGRWIEPGGLPYAIVGDLQTLPRELERTTRIMERFDSAAVIERTDGLGVCHDTTPGIDLVNPKF